MNIRVSVHGVEDLVLALDVSARAIQDTHEHLLWQMSKNQRADKDKAAWSRKEDEALWSLTTNLHAIEVAHAVLLVKLAAQDAAAARAVQSPSQDKRYESLSPTHANRVASNPTSRQTIHVALTLDMNMNEITGKHIEFMQAVEADVAMAVGGDGRQVRVVSLEAGSIIVHLELGQGIRGGEDAADVAHELERQSADSNSALRQGKYTCKTMCVTVSGASVEYACTMCGETMSRIEYECEVCSKSFPTERLAEKLEAACHTRAAHASSHSSHGLHMAQPAGNTAARAAAQSQVEKAIAAVEEQQLEIVQQVEAVVMHVMDRAAQHLLVIQQTEAGIESMLSNFDKAAYSATDHIHSMRAALQIAAEQVARSRELENGMKTALATSVESVRKCTEAEKQTQEFARRQKFSKISSIEL